MYTVVSLLQVILCVGTIRCGIYPAKLVSPQAHEVALHEGYELPAGQDFSPVADLGVGKEGGVAYFGSKYDARGENEGYECQCYKTSDTNAHNGKGVNNVNSNKKDSGIDVSYGHPKGSGSGNFPNQGSGVSIGSHDLWASHSGIPNHELAYNYGDGAGFEHANIIAGGFGKHSAPDMPSVHGIGNIYESHGAEGFQGKSGFTFPDSYAHVPGPEIDGSYNTYDIGKSYRPHGKKDGNGITKETKSGSEHVIFIPGSYSYVPGPKTHEKGGVNGIPGFHESNGKGGPTIPVSNTHIPVPGTHKNDENYHRPGTHTSDGSYGSGGIVPSFAIEEAHDAKVDGSKDFDGIGPFIPDIYAHVPGPGAHGIADANNIEATYGSHDTSGKDGNIIPDVNAHIPGQESSKSEAGYGAPEIVTKNGHENKDTGDGKFDGSNNKGEGGYIYGIGVNNGYDKGDKGQEAEKGGDEKVENGPNNKHYGQPETESHDVGKEYGHGGKEPEHQGPHFKGCGHHFNKHDSGYDFKIVHENEKTPEFHKNKDQEDGFDSSKDFAHGFQGGPWQFMGWHGYQGPYFFGNGQNVGHSESEGKDKGFDVHNGYDKGSGHGKGEVDHNAEEKDRGTEIGRKEHKGDTAGHDFEKGYGNGFNKPGFQGGPWQFIGWQGQHEPHFKGIGHHDFGHSESGSQDKGHGLEEHEGYDKEAGQGKSDDPHKGNEQGHGIDIGNKHDKAGHDFEKGYKHVFHGHGFQEGPWQFIGHQGPHFEGCGHHNFGHSENGGQDKEHGLDDKGYEKEKNHEQSGDDHKGHSYGGGQDGTDIGSNHHKGDEAGHDLEKGFEHGLNKHGINPWPSIEWHEHKGPHFEGCGHHNIGLSESGSSDKKPGLGENRDDKEIGHEKGGEDHKGDDQDHGNDKGDHGVEQKKHSFGEGHEHVWSLHEGLNFSGCGHHIQ